MDTPEKAQIGSPMSNFEESPFSNFVNSLSPIKPSKAIRVSHTFGSLSFVSPSSVFTSPQINLQRESRFLRRDQLPELAKPDSSSDNENNSVTHKDAVKADYWHSNSANGVEDVEPSNHEGFVDASSEASNLALTLQRELKYDCGSSNFQTAPSFGCEMILKSVPGTSSRVPLFHESSTTDSFGTQLSSVETDQNMGGSECVWDNLIYDAADLLVFKSPQGQGALKDHPEKPADEQTDFFASLLSHFPEDDVNDLEQLHGLGPLNSDVLLQRKDQLTQLAQANKLKQIYQGQDNDGSSSLNGSFTGQTVKKMENKPIMPRGIRRRCLVFEIPGARKNVDDGSISTTLSQDEVNTVSNSKQPAVRQGGDSPMCIRPGIGLHLNALAVGHRVLKSENPSMPGSSEVFPSPETSSENFQSSAPISSQELGNVENEVQGAENASPASVYGFNEDLNPSSPKKKRRRSENSGEGEACKRCNCKKSKCLKLYCECFAAGVYCVEPCACQDCFNKPIHEDTVLATRKQIESRNPLAFAPKVIKGSESVIDLGDDSNQTPASARHKRGCNCKKSNCLKKYCECYQGGVGCSIGCRCEGCKNTFGRKDGSIGIGMELEVEEDTPAHEDSMADRTLVQPGIHNYEKFNPLPVHPKTPLRLFRSPMPLPSASNGKPPRFGGISSCSLLNHDGTGRSTFLRSQHKTDVLLQNAASGDDLPAVLQNTSPSSSIKTLSPNSKRITPPNHESLGQSPGLRSSRKLILQSIPSFPSLTPRR